MLLIFKKCTSNWWRLTKYWSWTTLEPLCGLVLPAVDILWRHSFLKYDKFTIVCSEMFEQKDYTQPKCDSTRVRTDSWTDDMLNVIYLVTSAKQEWNCSCNNWLYPGILYIYMQLGSEAIKWLVHAICVQYRIYSIHVNITSNVILSRVAARAWRWGHRFRAETETGANCSS